ncbi:glycoside hydrolase family 28 protein [Botrimarina colliarenosi]|uniref:glycoside hydrolase family 28 protein n=1 Tax=Botrimarina colliarenosi TaxID=2528001 RepID=UPI0018D2D469|nr:glycosyl hydrolase family 28 protein [Botrimarina colliarenosi]
MRALLLVVAAWPVGATALATDYSIVDHGVLPESEAVQTGAIQSVIDRASADGGGRVVIPAGVFRSGALWLKAGVELHLAEGAVLLGSADIADYPTCQTRIEGKVQPWRPALINAVELTNVQVTGSGVLDGGGKPYWTAFWKRRAENRKCTNLEVERPRLMYFEGCQDVAVSGVRLKDSGFWNLHVYRCVGVVIEGVSITAPHGDPPKITGDSQPWDEVSIDRAPSSDGIDVDSCQDVVIRRCMISVGDDCIALKGTKGPHALDDVSSPPVEGILVEDCDFQSGHGVLTCGSEATIVRNVVVRRCRVGAAIPVVRLKLRPDTPQTYENLLFEDLTLDGAQALFDVKPWTQFFDLQGAEPPRSVVRGVTLRRIRGSVQSLGELRGNPGDAIEQITLEEIEIDAARNRFAVGEVDGLTCRDVVVNGEPYDGPTD